MEIRKSIPLLFLALCLFIVPMAHAESETTVKAAYLVNFAKLVEWPATAFQNSKSPLIIGVIGHGLEGGEIARAVQGASANGRPIEAQNISTADSEALAACHVIFIPGSERMETVLSAVQGHPVLIVGEALDFARRGGAIGFVKDGGTLKFEANPTAATRMGLIVSAKLLRVARIVVVNR